MSDIECHICLNPFDEKTHIPLILNCGHTFCERCIQQATLNSAPSDNTISCPTCNKVIPFSPDSHLRDQFNTNYIVFQLQNKIDKNYCEHPQNNLICADPKCASGAASCYSCFGVFHQNCDSLSVVSTNKFKVDLGAKVGALTNDIKSLNSPTSVSLKLMNLKFMVAEMSQTMVQILKEEEKHYEKIPREFKKISASKLGFKLKKFSPSGCTLTPGQEKEQALAQVAAEIKRFLQVDLFSALELFAVQQFSNFLEKIKGLGSNHHKIMAKVWNTWGEYLKFGTQNGGRIEMPSQNMVTDFLEKGKLEFTKFPRLLLQQKQEIRAEKRLRILDIFEKKFLVPTLVSEASLTMNKLFKKMEGSDWEVVCKHDTIPVAPADTPSFSHTLTFDMHVLVMQKSPERENERSTHNKNSMMMPKMAKSERNLTVKKPSASKIVMKSERSIDFTKVMHPRFGLTTFLTKFKTDSRKTLHKNLTIDV